MRHPAPGEKGIEPFMCPPGTSRDLGANGILAAAAGVLPARRLLVADADAGHRARLAALLGHLGHDAETACCAAEVLERLGERPDVDLVLLDLAMPDQSGFDTARRLRGIPGAADLPVVAMTAPGGWEDRLRAIEAGVNDFIDKPVDPAELRIRVTSQLKMKAVEDQVKRHQAELEALVAQRTVDLCQALIDTAEAQRKTFEAHLDTIHRLALAAEHRDEHTAAHIQRVSHYCGVLAHGLGLAPHEVEMLRRASPMHDVGKIAIPDAILLKKGRLTESEREVMRQHTIIGARILSGSTSELLQAGEIIALSHHEKWDGTGYPNGLRGESIPLYGRICAVADVFDALTSRRPYKVAFPNDTAYALLREGRGFHFDPRVLDLLFESLPEINAVQDAYRDAPAERLDELYATD